MRSRSLPLTWTIRVTVSLASSAGSATGQGCSQTRPPFSRSHTSAPRWGAKGKISEAAVAVAKRTAATPVGSP